MRFNGCMLLALLGCTLQWIIFLWQRCISSLYLGSENDSKNGTGSPGKCASASSPELEATLGGGKRNRHNTPIGLADRRRGDICILELLREAMHARKNTPIY